MWINLFHQRIREDHDVFNEKLQKSSVAGQLGFHGLNHCWCVHESEVITTKWKFPNLHVNFDISCRCSATRICQYPAKKSIFREDGCSCHTFQYLYFISARRCTFTLCSIPGNTCKNRDSPRTFGQLPTERSSDCVDRLNNSPFLHVFYFLPYHFFVLRRRPTHREVY